MNILTLNLAVSFSLMLLYPNTNSIINDVNDFVVDVGDEADINWDYYVEPDYIEDGNVYDPNFYAFTDFSMENYFHHLSDYSPRNLEGSCAYVSLIQVMSYYDTFLNDTIIPNAYDKYSNNITTLSQAMNVAPGVIREDMSYSLYGSVYNFCHATSSYNFQSKLMTLYNDYVGTDNPNDFNTHFNGCYYQNLLNYYYQDDNYATVTVFQCYSNSDYETTIKSYIDSSTPVILHIRDSNYNAHSVVAYDYDSNHIYANYGWYSSDTHCDIYSRGYDIIFWGAVINFNVNHYHSNNYKINNIGYCGCNPNNLDII